MVERQEAVVVGKRANGQAAVSMVFMLRLSHARFREAESQIILVTDHHRSPSYDSNSSVLRGWNIASFELTTLTSSLELQFTATVRLFSLSN